MLAGTYPTNRGWELAPLREEQRGLALFQARGMRQLPPPLHPPHQRLASHTCHLGFSRDLSVATFSSKEKSSSEGGVPGRRAQPESWLHTHQVNHEEHLTLKYNWAARITKPQRMREHDSRNQGSKGSRGIFKELQVIFLEKLEIKKKQQQKKNRT